jgi:hypothetical protein
MQLRSPRNRVEEAPCAGVLVRRPRLGLFAFGVLEPAVGIRDLDAVDQVDVVADPGR